MEETYLMELNICNFKGLQTEAVYTCFNNELCCDEGCCPKATFSLFRIWYFWITVIGLLFVLTGGCKICKCRNRQTQVSTATRRSRNAARFRRQSPAPGLSPITYDTRSLEMYFGNPRREELDELINLRRLLAQQEACNVAIDRYVACQNARREQVTTIEPPSYNSLQIKTTQVNTGDPPPNYNTVCKDVQVIQVRSNINTSPNAPTNLATASEHIRIDIPSVHTQGTMPLNQGGNIARQGPSRENGM